MAPAQAQTCTPLPQIKVTGASPTLSGQGGVSNIVVVPTAGEGNAGGTPTGAYVLNCVSVTTPANPSGVQVDLTGGQGGGGKDGVVGDGDSGAQGGNGGTIVVENVDDGVISTQASGGSGVTALSQGGNGGEGGSAGLGGSGGSGGMGGNGGDIILANAGAITTTGTTAYGMLAVSQGGGAAQGGGGGIIWGSGGSGGAGGNSGADITELNSGSIATSGDNSTAMGLHSLGGNGGDGNSSTDLFVALGGSGGAGGNGGDITASNSGSLSTGGANAKGISAISIGGGGGDGGGAYAAAVFASVAVGGSGGGGGFGGAVQLDNSGQISTQGVGSYGIRAQTIGGGGGDGGNAASVAAGPNVSVSVAVGGSGGGGGGGGALAVTNDASGVIATGVVTDSTPLVPGINFLPGDLATGILAQSIGGGGGAAGVAVAVSAALGQSGAAAVSVAIGGAGGSGGDGGAVTVTSYGDVITGGRFADGILAQSIGGGGGSGGNAVTVAAALGETAVSVGVALGGSGGSGGNGDQVQVTNDGLVTTLSAGSAGIVAQSIGGGGGNGGSTVDVAEAGGQSPPVLALSIGGTGGSGGVSGQAQVTTSTASDITTFGEDAAGVIVQSIGGGGGNGGEVHSYGLSMAGNASLAALANVGVGGSGGQGALGGPAQFNLGGEIATFGDNSAGAIVQSIGGGGGNGGYVFALGIASSADTSNGQGGGQGGQALAATVSVGGNGGVGGDSVGAALIMAPQADISTQGLRSPGVLVQSIGGGGGNGGDAHSFSVATDVPNSSTLQARYGDKVSGYLAKLNLGGSSTPTVKTKNGLNASISVGGTGGAGGMGGQVRVSLDDNDTISTVGSQSHGIVAQSIGGGGGTGGDSIADGYAGVSTYGLTLSLGGDAGAGSDGGAVTINSQNGSSSISTAGEQAFGVLAQSIGGGGGEGGAAYAALQNLVPKLGKKTLNISIGGDGGVGGDGGQVELDTNLTITTTGDAGNGIVAQSVGGGGGAANASTGDGLIAFAMGGSGGAGGQGGQVTVNNTGLIETSGAGAIGILAQSVGGGGGAGGVAGGGTSKHGIDYGLSLRVGGDGGGGGDGGDVMVTSQTGTSTIVTHGAVAFGVMAQSVGGGGGLMQAVDFTPGVANFQVDLLSTPTQGAAGNVTVRDGPQSPFSITTAGAGAIGILAQAISGDGASLLLDKTQNNYAFLFDKLAQPKLSGSPGTVAVDLAGTVTTTGAYATGVFAQNLQDAISIFAADGVLTFGAALGAGGDVHVNIDGAVKTSGDEADAVFAQTEDGQIQVKIAGALTTSGVRSDGVLTSNDGGQTNVEVAGAIAVSGDAAWGVQTLNGAVSPQGPTGESPTTEVQVDLGATIVASPNAAGAIFTSDGFGAANIDVYGAVDANTAYAIRTDTLGVVTIHPTGNVYGTIASDLPLTPQTWSDQTPKLVNGGVITGSVQGFGTYQILSGGTHYLNIQPNGANPNGSSNTISVGALEAGPNTILPYLGSLQTANFAPIPIISVLQPVVGANGGAPTAADFGVGALGLATHFGYAVTNTSVAITGIAVNYAQPGLSSASTQAAKLATAQVASIARTETDIAPTSPLYVLLLDAANATTIGQLSGYLKLLDATAHYSDAESGTASATAALTNMQSCGGSEKASLDPIAQGDCYWAKFTYAAGEREDGAHRDSAYGGTVGRQWGIAPHYYLGVSANYEATRLTSATAYSDGSRATLGAILKYVDGHAFASLSVVSGYGWADGVRGVVSPTDASDVLTARSDHRLLTVTTRLRGGYLFDFKAFDVTPMMDVDVPIVHDFGYAEHGAGALDMRVAAATNALFEFHPAVQIGGHLRFGLVSIRGYGEFGARFEVNDIVTRVSLPEGFATDAQTQMVYRRDRTLGTFAVGSIIDWTDRLESRVTYERDQGAHSRDETVAAKMAFKF